MKNAETVTFGGSGLDRVAELRGNTEHLSQELSSGRAQIIVLWRGKVLLAPGGETVLRVSADHPLLDQRSDTLVLLGDDDGTLVFCADISAWEPADVDAAAMDSFLDPTVQQHPAVPDAMGFHELRSVMTLLSPRDAELASTGKALQGWHVSHRFCACCGKESIPAMAGWQRNCPDCGGHHFPRTDPVVIMLITRGNSVLVGRNENWPEGMYSLLAGFVEPGETLEAAVRREVFEESGIKVGEVSYLASQPWAFPSSLMIGCRGEALSEEITIDPVELEDAIWVPREEMAQALAGEHPLIKPARRGAIAQFLMINWLADRLD